MRDAVIEVATYAKVQRPIAQGDLVLDIQGSLTDVSVAVKTKQCALRRGAAVVPGRIGPRKIEATEQRNKWRRGVEIGRRVGLKAPRGALRRIVHVSAVNRIAIGIDAWRVDGWVGKADVKILRQQGVLKGRARFHIVMAF